MLLPFEKFERNTLLITNSNSNGTSSNSSTPIKAERKKQLSNNSIPIATIDISDSPIREISNSGLQSSTIPRLRTPPPGKRKGEHVNGEKNNSGRRTSFNSTVEEEISKVLDFKDKVKPENGSIEDKEEDEDSDDAQPEHNFDPSNILKLGIGNEDDKKSDDCKDYIKVTKSAVDLNQEFLDSLPKAEIEPEEPKKSISVIPSERLMNKDVVQGLLGATMNGTSMLPVSDKVKYFSMYLCHVTIIIKFNLIDN